MFRMSGKLDWPVPVANHYMEDHPTFQAYAAKARLLRTDGFDALLGKMSKQDRPIRVQGKIMNLIQAHQHRALARSLPDREAVTLHHQSMIPHWVSRHHSQSGGCQWVAASFRPKE